MGLELLATLPLVTEHGGAGDGCSLQPYAQHTEHRDGKLVAYVLTLLLLLLLPWLLLLLLGLLGCHLRLLPGTNSETDPYWICI
jgi:hypothetical protein